MIQHDTQREHLELNMAPMIDMVFLLIIFFLTATTFTQREREQDVLLPTTVNPGSLSRRAERNVVVNVFRDGQVRVMGSTVEEDELVQVVRARKELTPAPIKVLVRADRRALYGTVARTLAAIERAGVQRPYIVTKLVELEP